MHRRRRRANKHPAKTRAESNENGGNILQAIKKKNFTACISTNVCSVADVKGSERTQRRRLTPGIKGYSVSCVQRSSVSSECQIIYKRMHIWRERERDAVQRRTVCELPFKLGGLCGREGVQDSHYAHVPRIFAPTSCEPASK